MCRREHPDLFVLLMATLNNFSQSSETLHNATILHNATLNNDPQQSIKMLRYSRDHNHPCQHQTSCLPSMAFDNPDQSKVCFFVCLRKDLVSHRPKDEGSNQAADGRAQRQE